MYNEWDLRVETRHMTIQENMDHPPSESMLYHLAASGFVRSIVVTHQGQTRLALYGEALAGYVAEKASGMSNPTGIPAWWPNMAAPLGVQPFGPDKATQEMIERTVKEIASLREELKATKKKLPGDPLGALGRWLYRQCFTFPTFARGLKWIAGKVESYRSWRLAHKVARASIVGGVSTIGVPARCKFFACFDPALGKGDAYCKKHSIMT